MSMLMLHIIIFVPRSVIHICYLCHTINLQLSEGLQCVSYFKRLNDHIHVALYVCIKLKKKDLNLYHWESNEVINLS